MIAFSGIDCAGKSTQIEKVAAALRAEGKRCKIIHSRGGYTPVLEFCKTLFRPDKGGDAAAHAEYRAVVHGSPKKRKLLLWLSVLDLALYYGIYFRLAECCGVMILADRYFWDSYIDFSMKYGELDFEAWRVWRFARVVYLKPKISIIYTIDAELSVYRSTLKNEPWPEPQAVREERIARYCEQIKQNRWQYVLDAAGSVDAVFNETMRVIKSENQ